jgi:hypothetical protein
MIIRNFGTVASGDARVTSAIVSWEDRVYPDQELNFEIHDGELDARQGTETSPLRMLSFRRAFPSPRCTEKRGFESKANPARC